MITKYQQGGNMEQQIVSLVQAALSGDQQATQQINQIMQAAKSGDKRAAQLASYIQQVAQKLQGSRKARLGAKLNYNQEVVCAEDEIPVFMKRGGQICKTCQKLKQGAKKLQKKQKGSSFQNAWNQARNAGNRYFWFKGKTYNTKKKGENDAYWGAHFKDNSTSGGANNIQTDVGLSGGWKGHKGANVGRYNSKGKWIRSKQSTTNVPQNAVYGARGNSTRQSNYKIFAPIDKPNTTQVVGKGTNQRQQTRNTNMIVGGAYPAGQPLTFGGQRYEIGQSTPQFLRIYQGGFNSSPTGSYWINPTTPGYYSVNK